MTDTREATMRKDGSPSKRGGKSLHEFIIREAASTGQLKKDANISKRVADSHLSYDHAYEPGPYKVCRRCGHERHPGP